jgi:PTS system mannose-specific IIB component/fructoselysine and glucoselysine-specific PTS system IIB component
VSLVLVRIDDRLIHGQVVVGWGQALMPHRLVLADDTVAASEWERELYATGVPPELKLEFVSVDEAASRVDDWEGSNERTILLLGDVDSLVRLCDHTTHIRKVNLGGIHRDEPREQRLPYVYLSDEELNKLQALSSRGVEITAQDVPTAAEVPLGELS